LIVRSGLAHCLQLLFLIDLNFMRVQVIAAFMASLGATCAVAGAPTGVRYIDIGQQGKSQLLASDGAGNLFVVSQVIEPSGAPAIRATKTDPQGNTLAWLDFGGGGASQPDAAAGAAVDSQGDLIIVGTTRSANFPVTGLPGLAKTFVVKIDNALGNILLTKVLQGFSTAGAVAVDPHGDIFVAGATGDPGFLVTPGAFQSQVPPKTLAGSSAAYLTELSPDGSQVLFSTLYGGAQFLCPAPTSPLSEECDLGGAPVTIVTSLKIAPNGAVVITGNTDTTDLPVTANAYAQQCNCLGVNVGFVASFALGGSKLNWATYLPTLDNVAAISVTSLTTEPDNSVVIAGLAEANNIPVTAGVLQPSAAGSNCDSAASAGFVSKFDPLGQHLLFSTYLGGCDLTGPLLSPAVSAVAVDSKGTIWITGASDPPMLPIAQTTPMLGSQYTIGLSSDGSSIESAFTAPAGATGQALVITPQGAIMTLGAAGSILPVPQNQSTALFGVANAAGSQVSGIVAPYELVSFYGIGLGPAIPLNMQIVTQGLNEYASTSLGGFQVLFDGVAAPLLYAGPNQINAIVPAGVADENATTVQIVTPNGTIAGPSLIVRPSHPDVFRDFQISDASFPPALALNQNGTVNSISNPAAQGSIVTVFASGGGGLNLPDGEITSTLPTIYYLPGGILLLPVSVVDNSNSGTGNVSESLEVLYAGQAPGEIAGVIQVNFQLPQAGASYSSYQVQIGDAISAPFTVFSGLPPFTGPDSRRAYDRVVEEQHPHRRGEW
jgi:uncharacterized protein (TIGR03437 family)